MLTSLFQQQFSAPPIPSSGICFSCKCGGGASNSVINLQLFRCKVGNQMAAMATRNAASTMQTANLTTIPTSVARSSLSSSTVRFGPGLRLTGNAASKSTGRVAVIRAAGDPERIDRFVEGAKSDASKNAESFGDQVAQKAGEVQNTVEDVGRDMGAKAQEAVDAGSRKVDQAGDRAKQVGDEVKGSTQDTIDSAKNTRKG